MEFFLGLAAGVGASAPVLAFMWRKLQGTKRELLSYAVGLQDEMAQYIVALPEEGSEELVLYWRDKRDEARDAVVRATQQHQRRLRG